MKEKITYYTKEGRFETSDKREIPFNKLHNLDGPALIHIDGTKVWGVNGIRHRIDGPAVMNPKYGFYVWWVNDQIHRDDGPAVIDPSHQEVMWYLYGQEILGVNEWLKENDIDPLNMSEEDIMAFKLRWL